MAAATDLQAVYGRTTGVGANRDVAGRRGRGARAQRPAAAQPRGRDGQAAAARHRARDARRPARADGGGRRRAPPRGRRRADRRAAPAARCPSCATSAGSAPATSRCSASSGWRCEARGLEIQAGDALALMSSNAATFASAALAWHDVAELLDAGLGDRRAHVLRARGQPRGVRGGRRRRAAARRPRGGQRAAARAHRRRAGPAARIQDPFGLRCLPPVAGALDVGASATCTTCSPSRSTRRRRTRWWPARRSCTTAASTTRPARSRSTGCGWRSSRSPSLSAARLTHLMAPELTGLPRVPLRRRARQLRRADRASTSPPTRSPACAPTPRPPCSAPWRSRAGWRSTPASPGRPPARRATRSSTCAPCSRSSGSWPSGRCG